MNNQLLLQNIFIRADELLKQETSVSGHFVGNEIKLSTDIKLDDYFRSHLENETGIPVYSEETLGNASPLKGKVWIVDPLDGSLNYYRQIPFYASSIALWENGLPLLGGIYDYSRKDFYFGELGKGAFLNDSPIHVSDVKKNEGIKATGIPSHTPVAHSLSVFEESLKNYKKLRWFGCASLSLSYVACGKVDAYEEKGIKLWDVAAGIALVMAAKGQVNYSFNDDGSLDVLAINNI